MIEFYNILGLISIVILCVLLKNVNNYFKITEKSLNQIKSQIEALAKAQASSNEEKTEKTVSAQMVSADVFVVTQTIEEEEEEEEEPIEEIPNEIIEELPPVIPPVLPSAPAEITPKRKSINYEKFIGENLFGKIGILVFVIGVALFVKYAIDQEWINETFRTILGFLTGMSLLATAGVLQTKYRTFSSMLAGGAFAVFYLTVAIAFHYYHLFSQSTAFIILIVNTVLMSTLAVLYDRRELAITSLVGGFIAPFIVSSGSGSYLVLFTYISILNIGMFWLSLRKKWSELPVISFIFTYIVMGGFVMRGYGSDVNTSLVSSHLFAFATLFYFIFLLPILSILRINGKVINYVLLSTIIANNFIYMLLGSKFLDDIELPFRATGLLTLFIAIVNLNLIISLRKRVGDYRTLHYTILGLVLTFVSITVPIQLEGNYITLFWASEMVLLLWLYAKSKIRVYEYATLALVSLTLISFLMDVLSVSYDSTKTIFLNGTFATSLFMGLATIVFALLLKHYRDIISTCHLLKYTHWNSIMLIAGTVILYFTFMREFSMHLQGAVRDSVMLLFNSVSILSVCFAFRKRFPIEQYKNPYLLSIGVNVLIYMIYIWGSGYKNLPFLPSLLLWITTVAVIANLYYIARHYYTFAATKSNFTIYLNVLTTLLWLTMVRLFLLQIGLTEFSTAFSIAMIVAGFVQMGLGMRLHQKVLRIISLSTFGIVLFKLILIDLWAMPTVGKIFVFVILGLILLVLSFLYQKFKEVLFKNDEDENN